MRIYRSTSCFLSSAYSMLVAPSPELPPPPPYLAPCSASLGYHGAGSILSFANSSGELCKLNRSPWDLPGSDPQMVDDFLDGYYVEYMASYLSSANMPSIFMKKEKKPTMAVASRDKAQLQAPKKFAVKKEKMPKKAAMKMKEENKEGESKKRAKVKKEKGEEEAPHVLKCKKNGGRGWYCQQPVSRPNSLCERHFKKKRSYLNLEFASAIEEEKVIVMALVAPSKPSSNSKTRKKKPTNHFNATEGFYYYNGFGPLHSKRNCRRTTHDSAPLAPMQEEVEVELPKDASPLSQAKVEVDDSTNDGVAAYDDAPSNDDNDDIAGIDEGSNDDDYDPGSSSRSSINTKRNKNPWKHWRKPMKARSLKSLL